jgi:hypothetical protein
VELNICALAFVAALYAVVVLSSCNPISYLLDRYGRRSKMTHTSTQAEEINVALKAGQTIVGVMDTTTAMYFYIDKDVLDGKNYE